ncbi:MAG: hypothetical protein AB7F43_14555 [Bacteriovoracia bacterium]
MNTKNEKVREQHKLRVQRYRKKHDNVRLELLVPRDLATQFRTLPGLNDLSNAEKLHALCDAWLFSQAGKPENSESLDWLIAQVDQIELELKKKQ